MTIDEIIDLTPLHITLIWWLNLSLPGPFWWRHWYLKSPQLV